jgi:lipopolysaccharide export system ATP-binding protein
MTDAPPALECRALRVARGDKTILRGVSVRADPGEVVGVLGPSGAGKSTLFRTLVGEIAATEGTVLLGGRDVTNAPLWRRARLGVAYVPQTPSVLWDLSVRENLVAYHRVVHGKGLFRGRARLPGEEAAVDALAIRVALEDRMDVRAGDLSGGERRRLELARALTREPRVLVCDEPFAGVDPQHAGRLGDMLVELSRPTEARPGVAVLLADHHVEEALRVCTRALLLLDGEIAIDAAPECFRENPTVQGRYLGSWQRSLPPPP